MVVFTKFHRVSSGWDKGLLTKHSRNWWINLIHAFWPYISFFVSVSIWSSGWVLGQHHDQGPSCSVVQFGKTSSSWKCLNGSNLLPFHDPLCRCASGKTQSFRNNFAPSHQSMFHYNQRLTESSLNFTSWFLTSHAVRITHPVPEAWNTSILSDASGITDMQTRWRVALCLRTLGHQAITACF